MDGVYMGASGTYFETWLRVYGHFASDGVATLWLRLEVRLVVHYDIRIVVFGSTQLVSALEPLDETSSNSSLT